MFDTKANLEILERVSKPLLPGEKPEVNDELKRILEKQLARKISPEVMVLAEEIQQELKRNNTTEDK